MAIGGMAPQNVGTAIVLTDDSEGRGLLLRLGPKDAVPIALPFGHVLSKGYDRPLNRDLLYAAIRDLGGDLRSVRIDRLEDDVFYASVFLAKGGHSFELDARPSDALSLAIGSEVPVFVAEAVLARAGIDIEKFDFRRLREEPVPIRAGEREDGVEL
jgi:bifunctional DNase/RNase